MTLPDADAAKVLERKILYLLSEEMSGGKAKFFKEFGFSVAQWEVLKMAVLHNAQTYAVTQVVSTDFGVKYLVEGTFSTPDGRNPFVRSVWQIDHGKTVPRFVTAYPVRE